MNIINSLKKYIKSNYEKKSYLFQKFSIKSLLVGFNDICEESFDDYLLNNKKESFKELLFKYIDERNLKDSDVYNKVHIDRRLFNKIKNVKNYKPTKENIILLGISLDLSIDELLL